jgi:hypothetical protein
LLPSRSPPQPRREHLAVSAGQLALKSCLRELCDIIEAACEAWNKLIALPAVITSIGARQWTPIGQMSRPTA